MLKKRILSILLVLCMVMTLLPTTAWAADSDFTIENGVLTKYNGGGGNIVIPDEVRYIRERAFEGCSGLISVLIPNSVTNIGSYAFANCDNLKNISLSNSIHEINVGTFSGCLSLESLYIPDSVTIIRGNDMSFYPVSGAFENCTSLISVRLPEGLDTIESRTFYNCTALKEISIPNSVARIGGDRFGNYYDCPDGIFMNCTSLERVTLPSNLAVLPMNAFRNCSSITNLNFLPSSISEIQASAFAGCSNLSSATFPRNLTEIGESAFADCTKLSDIRIPDGITNIGPSTFSNCTNLKSIVLPHSITNINYCMFEGCSGLISVTIPDSITNIGLRAFSGCTHLTDIIIPESVTHIGREAFSNCTGLINVVIPDGVTSIGPLAFQYCTELTKVFISDSVSLIDWDAFENCTKLSDIYYAGSKGNWELIDGLGKPSGTTATIHYNSAGPDDVGPDNMNPVYFLSGWDSNTRTVKFGDEEVTPDTYTVADSVDVSNISSLLNKYVLVTMEQGASSLEYTITDIQPVESRIGTVSATGEHSLTIDGTTYPVREDYKLTSHDGKEVLYHVSNGTIMGYDALEEKTGILEAWDSATGKVTIDNKTYPTNYLSDLSYLKNLDVSSRPKVEYAVANGIDYQPILRLMVSSYEIKVGTFTQYDSATNMAHIDGQGYPVDTSSCNLGSNNFNGKQVFFLLKNGKIIHMDATGNVKSALRVTLSPQKVNVTYKDNKLSAHEFDAGVTVSHFCSYSFPDHYNRSIIYAAAGLQPIKLNKVAWEGDKLSFSNTDLSGATLAVGENQSGTVKVSIDKKYVPKDKTGTLVGTCIVTGTPTGGVDISARGTVNLIVKTDSAQAEKPEDSSEVKELTQKANEELEKTRIPFALKRDVMKNIFGLSGKSLDRFQQELFTVIVMSEIPEQTLREKIDDKVLTKLFGKWKPDGISATNYTLPLVYEMETKDYGRVTARFDCEIQAHNNPAFGMFINVYYTIISCENGNLNVKHEFLGGGVNDDMQAFADTVWNLVEGELKSAYDLAWGNSANEVADWLFDDTVKKILNGRKTTFKDEVWKLWTMPSKNVVNKCPTNVYVYDESNALCGSIEDDLVTKTDENFELYVEGDTKYIVGLEDGYTVKYAATDNGNMDVVVTEYAGYETPVRQIEHFSIPLIVNGYYSQNISDTIKPQVETYALISESQTVLPANSEKDLLQLRPAESYTEPVTAALSPDGKRVEFTDPAGLLAGGARVLAARYDGGRLAESVSSGIAAGESAADFTKALSADWRLFLLNPKTGAPLCGVDWKK